MYRVGQAPAPEIQASLSQVIQPHVVCDLPAHPETTAAPFWFSLMSPRLPGPIRCQQGRLQIPVRIRIATRQDSFSDPPDKLPVTFLSQVLLEASAVESAITATFPGQPG